MDNSDTIIAISTPLGVGGLGIVRLSGKKSLQIAKALFKRKGQKKNIPPQCPVLGYIYDHKRGETFEEAYLTYFPAPRTYTREDIVEISCHGSPVILEEIVRLGIRQGARLAKPGEFTLRAFTSGRVDILQAEAINDIIHAMSLKQTKIAFMQMAGSLSRKITDLRKKIIHILSQIEARIEFPDEGLRLTSKQISAAITKAREMVKPLVKSYDLGKILSEGVALAIVGKANVGKSTLFNTLLQKERAIVTPHPGTTRDYLSERLKIKDLPFTLFDLAGLDTRCHPVEKEGIKRGKKIARDADCILLLVDRSCRETEEDMALVKKLRGKKTMLLFNKSDLPRKMNLDKVKNFAPHLPSLEISALTGQNIEFLKDMIYSMYFQDEHKGEETVVHLRQKLLLEDILSALTNANQALGEGFSEEILAEEIRKILPLIGQLTGEIRSDEVIEEVFSRFCIGK